MNKRETFDIILQRAKEIYKTAVDDAKVDDASMPAALGEHTKSVLEDIFGRDLGMIPMYSPGDIVIIDADCPMKGETATIHSAWHNPVEGAICYTLEEHKEFWREDWLKPYNHGTGYVDNGAVDLTDLLKDVEHGTQFYSIFHGDISFYEVKAKYNIKVGEKPIVTSVGNFMPNGKYQEAGIVSLYPSKELYQKYRFEPAKAWQEWYEEWKKMKRQVPVNKEYWYVSIAQDGYMFIELATDVRSNVDNSRFKAGNYFYTEEEAEAACDKISEIFNQNTK